MPTAAISIFICDGVPQYRVALAPRALVEFADACAFNQTPDSVFTRGTICSIRTTSGSRNDCRYAA